MNVAGNIEEKDLDGLLRELFLEKELAGEEAMAGIVFGTDYTEVAIDPQKEQRVIQRLKGSSGGLFPPLFALLIAAGITSMMFHFAGPSPKEATREPASLPGVATSTTVTTTGSITHKAPAMVFPPNSKEVWEGIKPFSADSAPEDPAPTVVVPTTDNRPAPRKREEFRFTEKNVARYAEMKKQLLRMLLAQDEGLYTAIEEGSIRYQDKAMPIDAFSMRNFDITNLEYKIFLADLLAKGRTDEYNWAMPGTGVWQQYNCARLSESYFQDDKYDDFPVVNISAEAALLFCKWLEQEVNTTLPKGKQLTIRLPYDAEWIHAARMGYARIPDCSSYNTIFDARENYVDKGFIKRVNQMKKRDLGRPDPLDTYYAINRYGMDEGAVLDIYDKAAERMRSAPGDSLRATRMDAASMVGHVSSLIREKSSGKIIVMGSCWESKDTYLKMLREFNQSAASPYIGFRVVVVRPDGAIHKRPFY